MGGKNGPELTINSLKKRQIPNVQKLGFKLCQNQRSLKGIVVRKYERFLRGSTKKKIQGPGGGLNNKKF